MASLRLPHLNSIPDIVRTLHQQWSKREITNHRRCRCPASSRVHCRPFPASHTWIQYHDIRLFKREMPNHRRRRCPASSRVRCRPFPASHTWIQCHDIRLFKREMPNHRRRRSPASSRIRCRPFPHLDSISRRWIESC